jgi:CRISPR-associated protein Csd2
LAADTGFSDADLELLFQALEHMFEFDRSAARGEMSTCKLFVFKHDSKLGNAPAKKLFGMVQVKERDPGKPPRSFSDYEVAVDRASVPSGVTLIERV